MANRLTTWADGNVLTHTALNAEVDNVYIGTVDRTAGRWGQNDDIQVTFGSSQDAIIEFDTAQTNDTLMIGVDSTSRSLIICDVADIATNFCIAAQTNPSLFIHSADQTTIADYIQLYHNQTDSVINSGAGGIQLLTLGVGGKVFIGNTTNANMTAGLTIQQSAATNEALALKASITHGMTDQAETDVYAMFKMDAGTAALRMETFGTGSQAFVLVAANTTDNTTKSTASTGCIQLRGGIRSGTAVVAIGADANILTIRNLTTTRFIFDAEGSFHADVESTTFDKYDDVVLIGDFASHLANADRLRDDFCGYLKYNREAVEAANIAHFDDENPGHVMVNITQLAILQCFALGQLSREVAALKRQLEA